MWQPRPISALIQTEYSDSRPSATTPSTAHSLPGRSFSSSVSSSVSAIAAVLPIAAADRLEVRAAELRELVERSRREQSLLKSAGEALARHMAGIVQSVTGALSGTGVYGRRGRLREGAPLAAGIDLTS